MIRTICNVVATAAILAAAAVHARTAIVDVVDAAIPAGLDLAAVTDAITTGAADRRWTPSVVAPGHVEARLQVRSHAAVVDITFDESAYSIRYKDSRNLDYMDGRIHRNYNRWVANLNQMLPAQTGDGDDGRCAAVLAAGFPRRVRRRVGDHTGGDPLGAGDRSPSGLLAMPNRRADRSAPAGAFPASADRRGA